MMEYAKAITTAVVTLIFFIFFGEGTELNAHEAVGILLNAFFVWLVPNRKGRRANG